MEPNEIMNEEVIDIIIKYFQKKASEDEMAILQNWLAQSDANTRYFDELSDVWHSAAVAQNSEMFNTSAAYKKVKEAIAPPKKNMLQSPYFQIVKIAAVFVLAFVLGLYVKSFNKVSEQLVTEVKTPLGSKTQLSLPDGTKVWLNAGSKISYTNSFNKENRDIKLDGEAYFDVAHNKNMPFIIHPDNKLSIKVLGTAFNVKAYSNEGTVETTLERGSLLVVDNENDTNEAKLKPQQRAIFVKEQGNVNLSDKELGLINNEVDKYRGKFIVSDNVESQVFTSWKENKLVFRNESFASLVVKLERWYGTSIVVKDKEILKYHFNGSIENETLTDVMNIIKYTLPIKFVIKHNVIEITKK